MMDQSLIHSAAWQSQENIRLYPPEYDDDRITCDRCGEKKRRIVEFGRYGKCQLADMICEDCLEKMSAFEIVELLDIGEYIDQGGDEDD